jgi:hypothetical protein
MKPFEDHTNDAYSLQQKFVRSGNYSLEGNVELGNERTGSVPSTSDIHFFLRIILVDLQDWQGEYRCCEGRTNELIKRFTLWHLWVGRRALIAP